MGISQSVPSTSLRQKVFNLTSDTRGMMDELLKYMLKEISIRDFLALSNPTECKKYVIFLANDLYKHFYELDIVPIKDRKGVIAFRPIKDLIKDDDAEKQSLCLTLAYFYTRIFQIYGALALTVIDDANVISDSGITSLSVDTIKRGLVTPGYGSYMSRGGAAIGPPAAALNNFNFLRSFLYDEKDPQKGYLSTYTGEGNNSGKIYFYPKIEEKDEFGRPIVSNIISETKLQKGIFFIAYIGGNRYSQLEVYARVEGIGGNIKFTFGKFKYYNKKNAVSSESIDLSSDIIPNKNITIRGERPAGAKTYIYTIIGSDKSISEYFTEILSKVVEFLKINTLNEASTTTTSSGVIISETGTAKELSLARTVQNLTKTKPLGHCLARAMQLLKTQPLEKGDTESYICKAKFLEYTDTTASGTKTIVSRSGIPEPGKPLSDSPGLAALSQLFYDTISKVTPQIVIDRNPGLGPDKKSSFQLYMEFMSTMNRLFEGTMPNKEKQDNIENKGLGAIVNRKDSLICGKISGNLIVPANRVSNIYAFVNKLYQIQIKHAAECAKIIRLLFNIKNDKSSGRYTFSLSDNIIKKGFPEIKRINFIARELLVNYYSNCEETYLKGVKTVIESIPKTPVQATTAQGTAAQGIATQATPAKATTTHPTRMRMPGAAVAAT